MLSPAKRHVMRVRAAQESALAADSHVRPDASYYELQLAQLYEDKRRLQAIDSMKGKAELKRELIPKYTPYINGVIDSGSGVQDDIFSTLMLWHIDAGLFEPALVLARYAIEHAMVMPDNYQRSLPCIIAEEYAEAALKDDPVPANVIRQVAELVDGKDMPDQVTAKLQKALGLALEKSDPEAAIAAFEKALQDDLRAGVKNKITQLRKQLRDTATATERA